MEWRKRRDPIQGGWEWRSGPWLVWRVYSLCRPIWRAHRQGDHVAVEFDTAKAAMAWADGQEEKR